MPVIIVLILPKLNFGVDHLLIDLGAKNLLNVKQLRNI